jgi:fatty-acyl-CoA synthase
MVVDDAGPLSAWQLWVETDAVARALRAQGVGPGVRIGILARNSRQFVQALLGAAKVGADIVYLNPSFAGPQLADVAERESLAVIVHEDEFDAVVAGCDGVAAIGGTELSEIAAQRSYVPLIPTRHVGRQIILTSGTTGRPKGAQRSASGSASSASGLLEVPFRARDTVVIAAPLFHAWGLAHLTIAMATSSTVVIQRRFDPEATLAAIHEHRPGGLVVVPVMLQRILALDPATLTRHDTSSLRYIASSGSALGAPLVQAALKQFGPVLYNIYGSTEVALATVASPEDLRVAPSTAGRVALGSTVRILDDEGREVPTGTTGRVFVGSGAAFEGYTGGGTKEVIDGLMSSGDVGHFDTAGRLFIDGRDDDMIVSGGENVFPAEVEELLAAHPAVAEAAVVGVDDGDFGQALAAFIVKRPGAKLTKKDVGDHVKVHLARYKVPKHVTFVKALPRTETGKVRKRDLRP